MSTKLLCAVALALSAPAGAEVLHMYGPGGPAPAMMEAAKVYRAQTGTDVRVVAGPTKDWIGNARADADLVYSGAEHMMTDFVREMDGQIDEQSIDPLYLRVSNILVRPGNPRRIRGLRDLMKPGRRVMVVQGSGQTGLWEDMAGRTGDVRLVRALRRNIVSNAATSADAKAKWIADPSIDAWIIWGVWEKANPTIADAIAVEPQFRIYRDTATALTVRGKIKPEAKAFLSFLRSAPGAAIFKKWGWITGQARGKAMGN